jgi:hypothetical protein
LASLFELFATDNADANQRRNIKDAGSVLKSILKMKPAFDESVLLPVFPELCRLVSHTDVEVQLEACQVLVVMTDSGYSSSASHNVDPRYIALLLNSPDSRIRASGSRILHNFVRSADADIIQRLMACDNCAPNVTKFTNMLTVDCSNFKPERAIDALNEVISSGELLH